MKNKVLLLAFAAFTLAAIFSVVSNFLTPLSPTSLFAARWIAIATLAVYAFYKRSLAAGIFVAMVIGAAVGHDGPHVAVNLRLISMIFLRLIKTIIAPLLFATLVSGIAATPT